MFDKSQNFLKPCKIDTAKNPRSKCVKIPQKVAFNIASEASYVNILSEQKFIKKAKNGEFGGFL